MVEVRKIACAPKSSLIRGNPTIKLGAIPSKGTKVPMCRDFTRAFVCNIVGAEADYGIITPKELQAFKRKSDTLSN